MERNNTLVYLKCPRCSHKIGPKREYDPFTGMVHGSGWSYSCPECNSPMKVEKVEDHDGTTCSILESMGI